MGKGLSKNSSSNSLDEHGLQVNQIPPPNQKINSIATMLKVNPWNDENKIKNRRIKDDEILISRQSTTTQAMNLNDLDIQLKFARNYLSLSDEYQEWPCMLAITAPENNELRSGVDIICVIDVSASMDGDKLKLVQKTLDFMLTQLAQIDRVSIISFNSTCKKILPLTIMNDLGKRKASGSILTLYASGGTNIVDALDYGINIAVNRNIENNSTAIILLTDGTDNDSSTAYERAKSCISFYQSANISYTLHCFGYGKDHDDKTLSGIAEIKNGGFYYIEKIESIASAFANCLGELLSVMAIDVQISLITQAGPLEFSLAKVYSSTGDVQFSMPNIMRGDTKESVFLLGFPPNKGKIQENIEITPVLASISYTLLNNSQRMAVEKLLIIYVKCFDDEAIELDESVIINFYRVKTADILKEAAELGDTEKFAKSLDLLKAGVAELKASIVADVELIKILINDLESAQLKFGSRDVYKLGGRAEIIEKAMGHLNKRLDNLDVYKNNCQKTMQIRSREFFN